MIALRQITGDIIDVSTNKAFVDHYNIPNTYAKYIIDREINVGDWYDELLFNLPENSVIIDAGANVGMFGLYMLPKIKTIYFIEPSKENYKVLKAVEAQFFSGKSFSYQFALWKKYEIVNFATVKDNTTMNAVAPNGGDKIQGVSLLNFMQGTHIDKVDLLKLDIEGGEKAVIMEDDMIHTAMKRCDKIYLEVHPPWIGVTEQDLVNKIVSFGFTHKPCKRSMAHWFINNGA